MFWALISNHFTFFYTFCPKSLFAQNCFSLQNHSSAQNRFCSKMRWLGGETNCLSQSCAIQIVVVFVSLPTCVPMLLRSSPQEATRTGRTHSTHLRPFAKQSGATCAPQRPLTSFPPSFRAVTRKHLRRGPAGDARRGGRRG